MKLFSCNLWKMKLRENPSAIEYVMTITYYEYSHSNYIYAYISI